MRGAIHSLLVELSKTYKPCNVRGIYPPKINLSNEQTQEEMFNELRKIINFMKHPEYSYIMKNKEGY